MDDQKLIQALRVLHAADELRRILPRGSRDRLMIEADIVELTHELHRLLDIERGPVAELPADAFRAFLRGELRARLWSQRYLALRSGVSHSTISRLLDGGRMPSLATARRLTEALLGPVSWAEVALPVDEVPGDPVARVADALRRDPQLDRRGVEAVLSFYASVRPSSDPMEGRGRARHGAS